MPRFIVLLPLTTLFFVLSLAAISIGHQQPSSTWTKILHLDECELPCWIGIIPGQTTLAEAQKQIEQAYGDKVILQHIEAGYSAINVSYKDTGESLQIVFRSGRGQEIQDSVITTIFLTPYLDLSSYNKRPRIPDLYVDLGKPEVVRLASGVEKERVAVLYKEQRVQVFMDDLECDRLSVNQGIMTIVFIDPVPSTDGVGFPSHRNGVDSVGVIILRENYFHKWPSSALLKLKSA